MEIIIAIIAVLAIAIVLYSRKPKELVKAEQAEVAPYKVDAPAPVAAADVPVVISTPEPVVESAPVKAPRKPRAPKAEKASAKKAPAKATTKKPAAIKAKATTKKPAAVKAKPKKA